MKPSGLRGTAVTGVCWRQEGPGCPTISGRLQSAGSISAHPGLLGSPDPQQGCPKICPNTSISQQGSPRPAPAAEEWLWGCLCRGDKGILTLIISYTRLADLLCFKSFLCFGSSAVPPNPVLPSSSVGQQRGKGTEIWPRFPAVSNPRQSLQSHAVILLTSNTSSPQCLHISSQFSICKTPSAREPDQPKAAAT